MIGLSISVGLINCTPNQEEYLNSYLLTGELSGFEIVYSDPLNDTIFKCISDFTEKTARESVDVNSDGVDDYGFSFYYKRDLQNYLVNIWIVPAGENQIVAGSSCAKGLYHSVEPFFPLDTIHHALNWQSDSMLLYEVNNPLSDPLIYGNCYNLTDRYIAVRIRKDLKYYFGWINFSTSENFLEIDDYACSRFQAKWW